MRALLLRPVMALSALFVTIAAVLAGPAVPAHAAEHDPVVFVHGWNGSASNWDTMIDRLQADGWSPERLYAWDYNSSRSNVTTAEQLAQEVDAVLAATGADEVDIVTHSMGGLSSRHYLKFLDGTGNVDDWVSLGGPNHGTNTAYWCYDTSCHEMRYDSEFLTDLNSGDETPAGADNTHVGCVGHTALVTDSDVYVGVRDFIR